MPIGLSKCEFAAEKCRSLTIEVVWLQKKQGATPVQITFYKYPRSTSGGFHITTEGKDDPTGVAGGGFDVRIKAGNGGHLLFIQYKKGDLCTTSPDPASEFNSPPHDHFVFEINGTKTNQHFVLRNLANGIGGVGRNAVDYVKT
jgi:hypothetical protein